LKMINPGRSYHTGRSVSDLARGCRLMREGAYGYLHTGTGERKKTPLPGF
jgi:hypothetical protein